MTNKQRAAFEAWFLSERKWLPANASERMFLQKEGNYENWAVNDAWETWQAALASPEVQALRKDAERLNWIEEECGADFVCFSQGDWVVDMTDNYGTGETLRDAINAAMERKT